MGKQLILPRWWTGIKIKSTFWKQFTRYKRVGRGQSEYPEKHEKSDVPPRDLPLCWWPHASNCTTWGVPRHSRVRRETAIIGGLYTIVLLIELEHFIGVPSIGLEGRRENVLKPSEESNNDLSFSIRLKNLKIWPHHKWKNWDKAGENAN